MLKYIIVGLIFFSSTFCYGQSRFDPPLPPSQPIKKINKPIAKSVVDSRNDRQLDSKFVLDELLKRLSTLRAELKESLYGVSLLITEQKENFKKAIIERKKLLDFFKDFRSRFDTFLESRKLFEGKLIELLAELRAENRQKVLELRKQILELRQEAREQRQELIKKTFDNLNIMQPGS